MKTTPTDPAFPTKREALDPRATGWTMEAGMNLRTYIATRMMAAYVDKDNYLTSHSDEIAALAVRDADALIAELNKEQK